MGLNAAIMFVYLAFMLFIGFRVSKKVNTLEDFTVAGRTLTFPVLFGTLGATIIGGYCTIGLASYAYQNGIVGWLMGEVPFAIVGVLIGRFVVGRLRKSEDISVGDLFERFYGPIGRMVVSVLGFFLCVGIMGAQVNAIGAIGESFFGMQKAVFSIIAMGVIIIYSMLGALKAVVMTDLVQFSIVFIGIPLAVFSGIGKIGFHEVIEVVPSHYFSPISDWTVAAAISFMVGMGLGEQLVPAYTQRYYAGVDARTSQRATMATFWFYVIAMILTTSLGFFAYAINPNLSNPDMALPEVIKALLPAGLSGLVIAAIAAAVMSTADSYLISGSTIVMRDLYQRYINKKAGDSGILRVGRITTIAIGIGAILFSMFIPQVIDSLMYAYSFWVPTIVPPLILAAVWRKKAPFAMIASVIVGAAVTAVWTFALGEPGGVWGVLPGTVSNVLTFFIVYALTRNSKPVGIFKPMETL